MMLYLCKWVGDETDWITLTPTDPRDNDSSEYDEGICTGFKVMNYVSDQFISELLVTLNRYHIVVNVVNSTHD